MGYALAQAASEAGAEVTLVSGPTSLRPPSDVRLIGVETTEQMSRAVSDNFGKADILIMAAAPADFKAAVVADRKIKKSKSPAALEISPTVDILKSLKDRKRNDQIVVGFALETENGPANAEAKLRDKGLDLIVLNIVGEKTPFEGDRNTVSIIGLDGRREDLPEMSKDDLAIRLIERIAGI